ncbi:MAG: hypothetical protein CMF48_01410 [Legionellales bacterium]|nr:hypothetical protein [Legionellales bacterium]|tara:strand:+ start:334 stop:642 length:309 start_codon:yes stop_codon:yes gene_type:complete
MYYWIINLFIVLVFSAMPLSAAAERYAGSDEIVSVSADDGRLVLKFAGALKLSDKLTVTANNKISVDRTVLGSGMVIEFYEENGSVIHIRIQSDIDPQFLEH